MDYFSEVKSVTVEQAGQVESAVVKIEGCIFSQDPNVLGSFVRMREWCCRLRCGCIFMRGSGAGADGAYGGV